MLERFPEPGFIWVQPRTAVGVSQLPLMSSPLLLILNIGAAAADGMGGGGGPGGGGGGGIF